MKDTLEFIYFLKPLKDLKGTLCYNFNNYSRITYKHVLK